MNHVASEGRGSHSCLGQANMVNKEVNRETRKYNKGMRGDPARRDWVRESKY